MTFRKLFLLIAAFVACPRTMNALPITDLVVGVERAPFAFSNPDFQIFDTQVFETTLVTAGTFFDGFDYLPAYRSVSLLPGGGFSPMPTTVLPSLSPLHRTGVVYSVGAPAGQITFGGESGGPAGANLATTWSLDATPSARTGVTTQASAVYFVNSTGLIGGLFTDSIAAVGRFDSNLVSLPQNSSYSSAYQSSADGKIVVGDDGSNVQVWRSNTPETLQYTRDLVPMQSAPAGSAPLAFSHVFSDPVVGEIAVGYYQPNSGGETAVGVWNLVDGSFISALGSGLPYGARMFGDSLVVGINGSQGSFLTTLDRPDVALEVEELFPSDFGLQNAVLEYNGIYESGGLGILASGIVGGNLVSATIVFGMLETNSLPGDFDTDGSVDGSDFLLWQRGFGPLYDAADLEDWQNNYGLSSLSLRAIPEPSVWALAVVGVLCVIARAPRKNPFGGAALLSFWICRRRLSRALGNLS